MMWCHVGFEVFLCNQVLLKIIKPTIGRFRYWLPKSIIPVSMRISDQIQLLVHSRLTSINTKICLFYYNFFYID